MPNWRQRGGDVDCNWRCPERARICHEWSLHHYCRHRFRLFLLHCCIISQELGKKRVGKQVTCAVSFSFSNSAAGAASRGATLGQMLTPDARSLASLAPATRSCLSLTKFGLTTRRRAQSTSSAKLDPCACCAHLAQRRQQQLNFLELVILICDCRAKLHSSFQPRHVTLHQGSTSWAQFAFLLLPLCFGKVLLLQPSLLSWTGGRTWLLKTNSTEASYLLSHCLPLPLPLRLYLYLCLHTHTHAHTRIHTHSGLWDLEFKGMIRSLPQATWMPSFPAPAKLWPLGRGTATEPQSQAGKASLHHVCRPKSVRGDGVHGSIRNRLQEAVGGVLTTSSILSCLEESSTPNVLRLLKPVVE